MLVLDYNAINLGVGSRRGKRKALVIEDQHTRDEKKAKQINQSLLEGSRKGDLQLCIESIRDGADVSYTSCGLSPLFYAAFYGHDMIIDYLVNCGANVNEKKLDGGDPTCQGRRIGTA